MPFSDCQYTWEREGNPKKRRGDIISYPGDKTKIIISVPSLRLNAINSLGNRYEEYWSRSTADKFGALWRKNYCGDSLFCRQDFLCGEGRDDTVSAGLIQIRVWFLAIAGDIGIVACEYGTGLLLLRLSLPILAVYPVQLMESPYKRCMLGHDLNQTR